MLFGDTEKALAPREERRLVLCGSSSRDDDIHMTKQWPSRVVAVDERCRFGWFLVESLICVGRFVPPTTHKRGDGGSAEGKDELCDGGVMMHGGWKIFVSVCFQPSVRRP